MLFLTARDAVSDRVRGLDAGADDYLAKPFAFEELLAQGSSTGSAPGPGRGHDGFVSRSAASTWRRGEPSATGIRCRSRPRSIHCWSSCCGIAARCCRARGSTSMCGLSDYDGYSNTL